METVIVSLPLERALEQVRIPRSICPDLVTDTASIVAVTLHLLSPTPPFNRAVATGGTFLLRKALPAAAHEGIYQTAIAALGLDKLASEERINALLTKPMDEIIATLPPSVAFNAVVDNELIKSEVSYASVGSKDVTNMPGKEWLDALMVGDLPIRRTSRSILPLHYLIIPPSARANTDCRHQSLHSSSHI